MEKQTIINLIHQTRTSAEEESLSANEALNMLIEEVDAWYDEWY